VGDVADADRVVAEIARRHDVTSIVHCAAFIFVGESMRSPLRDFANNVAGTIRLLEACAKAGVRHAMFSSTAAVCGEPRHVPIPESHSTLPINPYGESKLMVERVLAWLAASTGLRYAVRRYFNAAGADPDGEIREAHDPETHLVPAALARLEAGGAPRLTVRLSGGRAGRGDGGTRLAAGAIWPRHHRRNRVAPARRAVRSRGESARPPLTSAPRHGRSRR